MEVTGDRGLDRRIGQEGFTLIELVMVILLLGVLAAVAIPNFFDFRTDARNAATQGDLGGMRSAIAIARAAIALREDTTAPKYPTILEMQGNKFLVGSHPVLSTASPNNIMDQANDFPTNPWSLSTIPTNQQDSIFDCSQIAKGTVRTVVSQINFGWCYDTGLGQIWANSSRNGGGTTENNY